MIFKILKKAWIARKLPQQRIYCQNTERNRSSVEKNPINPKANLNIFFCEYQMGTRIMPI